MVKIQTTLSNLQKEIGKKISAKELEETLFDMGYELESIEEDTVIIDITAERPDLISVQGLTRALKAYLGIKKGLPKYEVKKSGHKLFVKNTPSYWPYAVAFIAKNVKLDQEKVRELIQLQEKIGVTMLRNRKKGGVGLYPLQKLVFPITFEGRKPEDISFRPLEYPSILSAREILENHKKGKEYAHLMKDWKIYTVFVDAKGTIMSMPPIINSHDLGKIDETTTDLFIECTGNDLNTILKVMNIFGASFIEMGAKVESIDVHYKNKIITVPDLKPTKMKISVDSANKILGLNLNNKEAKDLLEKMMYDVVNEKNQLTVFAPAFRTDLWHERDIIDDIARAYTFHKFIPTFTHVETIGETTKSIKIKEELEKIMIGLGFQELFTLSLTSTVDQFKNMNISEEEHIRLGESTEKSLNMMRLWLLPELIKALVHNRNKEYPQKVFEVNYVVIPDKTKDVLSKNVFHISALSAHEKADFTEIKQIVHYILTLFGYNYSIQDAEKNSFIPGRVGDIIVNNKKVGFLGELHPQVLENVHIEVPIVGFEIDLTILFDLEKEI